MENSRGCVLSAAMFFNYAVMCPLSCSTLSVSEIIFQVTAGFGKNEIALPHENHHFSRLISINMRAHKKKQIFRHTNRHKIPAVGNTALRISIITHT